ncbi:MAG: MFS transporter, partial [Acidimicrobiia bacterium]|nr:MFS transporter [Acidimicrobiia bacterium]
MSDPSEGRPPDAGALSDQILAAEAERQAELAAEPVILDDDQLPGVGAKELSLREAISIGGVSTIVLLGALDATDALGISAMGLLGPDIQDSLGVSDAVLGTITAGGNVFIVAGGLLLSRIADNSNRAKLVALATIFWSAMTLLLGFVQTAFWFFIV